jgi:cytochrome c556
MSVLVAAGVVTSIGLAASVTAQQAALTPDKAKALMHYRHERMEAIRDNFKLAGKAVSQSSPDLAKAATPAATIETLSRQASHWFPAGTGPDVGKTMAKPAIWQNPQDFAAKMAAFQKAASTFNAAVKSGNAGAAKGAAGDLAKTCKSCHDLYRKEH